MLKKFCKIQIFKFFEQVEKPKYSTMLCLFSYLKVLIIYKLIKNSTVPITLLNKKHFAIKLKRSKLFYKTNYKNLLL